MRPKKAVINDSNEELINVYKVIRDFPEELIKKLEEHNKYKDSDSYFYMIRKLDRSENYCQMTDIDRAARIIYLNKTCFNGLYRVNTAGQFNSPFGRYRNPNVVNEVTVRAVSKYLNENDVTINKGDYKNSLVALRKGTFVYFDPPYMPISKSSSFTGYTKGGFNYGKQCELRNVCIHLQRRGIRFLQSNAYCPEIMELYSNTEIFEIVKVKATRSINSNGRNRGQIDEVLIYNKL